jgi:hypothetical protein
MKRTVLTALAAVALAAGSAAAYLAGSGVLAVVLLLLAVGPTVMTLLSVQDVLAGRGWHGDYAAAAGTSTGAGADASTSGGGAFSDFGGGGSFGGDGGGGGGGN